jgi:hypothetical protein
VIPAKDGRELNTECTAVTYKFVEPLPEKSAAPAASAKPAPAAPAKPGSGPPKKNTKLDF